jgi:hypothetical protein
MKLSKRRQRSKRNNIKKTKRLNQRSQRSRRSQRSQRRRYKKRRNTRKKIKSYAGGTNAKAAVLQSSSRLTPEEWLVFTSDSIHSKEEQRAAAVRRQRAEEEQRPHGGDFVKLEYRGIPAKVLPGGHPAGWPQNVGIRVILAPVKTDEQGRPLSDALTRLPSLKEGMVGKITKYQPDLAPWVWLVKPLSPPTNPGYREHTETHFTTQELIVFTGTPEQQALVVDGEWAAGGWVVAGREDDGLRPKTVQRGELQRREVPPRGPDERTRREVVGSAAPNPPRPDEKDSVDILYEKAYGRYPELKSRDQDTSVAFFHHRPLGLNLDISKEEPLDVEGAASMLELETVGIDRISLRPAPPAVRAAYSYQINFKNTKIGTFVFTDGTEDTYSNYTRRTGVNHTINFNSKNPAIVRVGRL